jgi:hypothetical protein
VLVVVVVVAKTTKGRPIACCCWLRYGACRNLAAVAMGK